MVCMYLDSYSLSYKFFSFLHHPGVSMVEDQEEYDTWTSTSCQNEQQEKIKKFIHDQGKHYNEVVRTFLYLSWE